MKIFAISDLHLSTTVQKPMDIFGPGWDNHFKKISSDWKEKVTNDDLVLIGGDISWGINLEEAKADFDLLKDLPGKKVIVKGNHDYYWNSLNKLRLAFPDFYFIQNNSYRFESENGNGIVIAGTRCWNIPNEESEEQDVKIFNHELLRLKMTLESAKTKLQPNDKLVLLLHFPPFDCEYHSNEFTNIIEEYKVDTVLYGHLHGKQVRAEKEITKCGINYVLTSCDLIDFKVIKLFEI